MGAVRKLRVLRLRCFVEVPYPSVEFQIEQNRPDTDMAWLE